MTHDVASYTGGVVPHPAQKSEEIADVLLIEDDEEIGRQIADGLRAAGHPTRWSRTGYGGLAEAERHPPRVVLLDLGLPDIDGVDVARRLRAGNSNLLMIILTARTDEMDVVVGLDAGADDYLTKPVSLTVLLARLRAHLRHRPGTAPPEAVAVGPLSVDAAARRCRISDVEVDLRAKELDLLLALATRAGTAVTREDLMATVWDENWFGSTKTLDVTMAALRHRLALAADIAGVTPPIITTLRGHGYRLDPPELGE